MVKIPPFDVEQWMDKYETTPGVFNIAETCCSSISIHDLVQFDQRKDEDETECPLDLTTRLTYGAIRGSSELRKNIASLYNDNEGIEPKSLSPESVIVTQGAIAANHSVFYSLVGPGDHVICVFPTYQQLYAVPESLGAEVSLWKLEAKDGFIPDVKVLEGLIKANTKMIVLNNPNNPTGATIPADVLAKIVSIARARDIILFSDEVYRPLFHSLPPDQAPPPSVISMNYSKTVATASMSKAWALAGIRVGWIASPNQGILDKIALVRDYTTISVSQLDDQVARYALSVEVRRGLLERNLGLARKNWALLEDFMKEHERSVDWIRPTAGTTAFIRFKDKKGEPIDDEKFCKDVIEKTKVMFLPGGRCFGHGKEFRGYVRIGYVCETEVLAKALGILGGYVKERLG